MLVIVRQAVFLNLVLVLALTGVVHANPFGAVVPAEPVPAFGFDLLVAWTAQAQGVFYDGLTGALRDVSSTPAALWTLLGLSFAYGVAHAAGPGHGKVVIGSYMLASGETARRGALLALGAAFVQASVAVALVGLLAGLFGLSRAVLTDATISLERFSYALIIVLGLYLVWRTARALVPRPALLASAGHAHVHTPHVHDHGDHVHGDSCGCDHAHMPDARQVAQSAGLWQSVTLVLGAGVRPCTGALLVLVLALSQGLFWVGGLAAFAMGAGTALTVGTLAVFASGLSGFLQRGQATTSALRYVTPVLSLMGGVMVVAFGALLLAASLAR